MIELKADNAVIQIEDGIQHWCRCYLLTAEGRHYLGAERLDYLVDHFVEGLTSEQRPVIGQIDGHDVRWVLSLAEAHHVLYIATPDAQKLLLWQDARAGVIIISRISLSHAECSEWCRQLLGFRQLYSVT